MWGAKITLTKDWISVVGIPSRLSNPSTLALPGKGNMQMDVRSLATVQGDLLILYLLGSHIHSEGKNFKKYLSVGMGVETSGFSSGAFFLVLNTQVNRTLFLLFSPI